SPHREESNMLTRSHLQTFLVLAVGLIAGYAAASGKLNPFQSTEAAADPPALAETACPLSGGPGGGNPEKTALLAAVAGHNTKVSANVQKDGKKPNILFIMGDDIGWFQTGAYHRGMMSGKTPNLDKLASQGMLFTDYYAEASCTAGRANFITGEIPLRTGL